MYIFISVLRRSSDFFPPPNYIITAADRSCSPHIYTRFCECVIVCMQVLYITHSFFSAYVRTAALASAREQ